MTQNARFWGGTTVGQATDAPYSSEKFADIMNWITTYDRTMQGVLPTNEPAYAGNLEVTAPGGAVVRVASGVGVVDGIVYFNNANVDNSVVAASVWYIVVLQKIYADQTVLISMRGTYASRALALASLVQTDGVTWEIPLATVLTTAGSIVDSITDERRFCIRPITKCEFLFIEYGYNSTASLDLFPGIGINFDELALTWAQAVWRVPENFHSNLTITPIAVGDGGLFVYVKTYAEYGGLGEAMFTHIDDTGYGQITSFGTYIRLRELSLGSASVGDFVRMFVYRNGLHASDTSNSDLSVFGFLIEYNSLN